jgi:predicted secreted protein
MKRIKGQDVNLFIDGAVVAGSTSCTFTLSANTADAASKTDPGDGMWDNPEFQNYNWQMGNESFVANVAGLQTLLQKVINGNAEVDVHFQVGDDVSMAGRAIITQLQVSAPNGEKVTLSLSLEGCTPLSGNAGQMDVAKAKISPIKGKAMMLAMQISSNYHTFAASTSHSLTVSVQTAETTTKDDNDMGTYKEATGKSVSLSTENLMTVKGSPSQVTGITFADMMAKMMAGETLKLAFGYYGTSIGAEAGADADWSAAETVLLSGDFVCTNLSANGANKENATYSAEFGGKGMPTVE